MLSLEVGDEGHSRVKLLPFLVIYCEDLAIPRKNLPQLHLGGAFGNIWQVDLLIWSGLILCWSSIDLDLKLPWEVVINCWLNIKWLIKMQLTMKSIHSVLSWFRFIITNYSHGFRLSSNRWHFGGYDLEEQDLAKTFKKGSQIWISEIRGEILHNDAFAWAGGHCGEWLRFVKGAQNRQASFCRVSDGFVGCILGVEPDEAVASGLVGVGDQRQLSALDFTILLEHVIQILRVKASVNIFHKEIAINDGIVWRNATCNWLVLACQLRMLRATVETLVRMNSTHGHPSSFRIGSKKHRYVFLFVRIGKVGASTVVVLTATSSWTCIISSIVSETSLEQGLIGKQSAGFPSVHFEVPH